MSMPLAPLEEFRLRLNRTAKRRGLHSPSTRRIQRVLDQMLLEWHDEVPPDVLAASVLQRAAIIDRADLVRRFERAKAASDSTTLASLLPLVMALPRNDADRPQMLNCCGIMMLRASGTTVPKLAEVALEEAIATAQPYSILQYKALTNLGALYNATGRFYTAYWLYRTLIRQRRAFSLDGLLAGYMYAGLARAAGWIGKPRLSYRAQLVLKTCDGYYERFRVIVDTSFDCDRLKRLPLGECKQIMRRWFPDTPHSAALLGNYACALLRHGYPRAALAVGACALGQLQRPSEQLQIVNDRVNSAEIHLIMAAAAQRLDQADAAQAHLARAREIFGNAELLRPSTVRMQDWQRLAIG